MVHPSDRRFEQSRLKMKIPLKYSWKNLAARRSTTALTTIGLALVVYVFATVLMLSEGLRRTLVTTGSRDNVMILRRGSTAEIQSSIDPEQSAIIAGFPEVALAPDGSRLVSKELLVLMVLPKRGSQKPANVTLRGSTAVGRDLRPQVRLVEGRWFRPGSSEIVAGNKIAAGFQGAGIGESLRFGQREWTVVGILDAGTTGFGSEIWGDVDQFRQAFRRITYSAVLFRLRADVDFDAVRKRLAADPRLTVEAKRESLFYAEQSEVMVTFLTVLGMTLSVVFSLAAVIGALITMYGAVANRTREIGTLRALGFPRRTILTAFLLESSLLGLTGGILGLLMASGMQWVTVSTMNWQTFAELAFTFTLAPAIVGKSLLFALTMGLLGGALPAARAARMDILAALRAG